MHSASEKPQAPGEREFGASDCRWAGCWCFAAVLLAQFPPPGESSYWLSILSRSARAERPGALLARVFQIGGSNGEFLASVRAPIARRIANEELGQKTDSKHCEDAEQKISPHYVSPFTATIAGAESLPPRRTEGSQGKREEFLSRVRETAKRARSVFMWGLIFQWSRDLALCAQP